jgi:putative SOS response-associated peptidase YedK
VPSFTKPGSQLDFYKMFNARSESVADKPVFSRLLSSHRCVVITEGFYEWKTDAGAACSSPLTLVRTQVLTKTSCSWLRLLSPRQPLIRPDQA